MRKILIFSLLFCFATSLFAGKGILRISANMADVDVYNGNEQIAMLGDEHTDLELEKGKYTIILRKPIDEYNEYFASKKVFVGADSITRIKFELKKVLTEKGKIKKAKDDDLKSLELEKRKKEEEKKRLAQKAKVDNMIKSGKALYHKGKFYKVITSPYTGKKWLDRNLGASRACKSSKDSRCYGDYFQWGRGTDGHEKKNSRTTSSLSNSDYPNHSKFIKALESPYDWRAGQNNKLWQSSKGRSNPCPKGFRVPTINELKKETINQGVKNARTAYKNFLKLPLSGDCDASDGLLKFQEYGGNIWSSSVKGKYSWRLYFNDSDAYTYSGNRAYGFSVRCLKD